jgi:hypothetical protein
MFLNEFTDPHQAFVGVDSDDRNCRSNTKHSTSVVFILFFSSAPGRGPNGRLPSALSGELFRTWAGTPV